MEIPIAELKRGDIIAFKGRGVCFTMLSALISALVPEWRKREWKPWHLAVAYRQSTTLRNYWILIEALAGGVQEKNHSIKELQENARVYRYLSDAPSTKAISDFKQIYLGFRYDAGAYLGTMITYFLAKLHLWHGRVIDKQHTCWETASAFARYMHKPFQDNWEYPVIWKIIKKLEETK